MFAASGPCSDRPDLAEPASFFEALQILRTEDPYYLSITSPSTEQVDYLNGVIKGLRLQLDGGVDEATGDKTAYELAVALLWHSDTLLIEEGVQLMEYLLKERWDRYWSMAIRSRPSAAVGDDQDEYDEDVRSQVVESVPDEDDRNDDEWVDIFGSPAEGQCANRSRNAAVVHPCSAHCTSITMAKSAARSGTQVILRGSAVQFATAPPPPENECGSVPPSLVRDRGQSSALTQGESGTTVSSSCACSTSTAVMAITLGLQKSLHSSYTGPDTAMSSTDKHALSFSDPHLHYERLAKCYYNLAVGYTKIRKNEKALFYISNMLRLSPWSEEGLLLRRLLCARLYVRHVFIFSFPLLAMGLLFL
ncbi:conserved hypothetical protein [Leishmania mexicana MHOM/GT/2001/U1103]|uniref:Uncharacterized protein n=1 Tax=Leishmania mexicana (strain MHOM/GT/2001/U1103) TaxID=929439 RepID=E9AU50_LEIMU|nr:conserved hypothetical protein [Leishmania mexicana MHOM/GT/2001/U1103]CBZ26475.1 conserved hypothetical protein [Leishmania mexicana MHOM/GT/2001/U1103]